MYVVIARVCATVSSFDEFDTISSLSGDYIHTTVVSKGESADELAQLGSGGNLSFRVLTAKQGSCTWKSVDSDSVDDPQNTAFLPHFTSSYHFSYDRNKQDEATHHRCYPSPIGRVKKRRRSQRNVDEPHALSQTLLFHTSTRRCGPFYRSTR